MVCRVSNLVQAVQCCWEHIFLLLVYPETHHCVKAGLLQVLLKMNSVTKLFYPILLSVPDVQFFCPLSTNALYA
jgi:hypothetical protein